MFELVVVCIVALTAWRSFGTFHLDEYAQTIEFAAVKLGRVAPEDAAWEWHARIRPFFQPAVYSVVMRLLTSVGVRNPFALTFALRLCTGAFATAAMFAMVRSTRARIDANLGGAWARAYLGLISLFGFLPYLFVRTSSETLSSSLFAFAYVQVLAVSTADKAARASATVHIDWRWATSGMLLGAAFEARFQTAFMIAGLVAWLIAVRKTRARQLLQMLGGFTLLMAAGVLIDRWGYGVWVLTPVRYFKENLLHGAAATFGTAPFFAYLYYLPANVFALPVALLLVAFAASVWRRRFHPAVWCALPFVLIHCALAHKEERFLFPLMHIALTFPLLALSPRSQAKPQQASGPPKHLRMSLVLAAPFSIVPMMLLMVYPFGFRNHTQFARYVYDHWPHGFRSYNLDADTPIPVPFYRRAGYSAVDGRDRAVLEAALASSPDGIEVVTAAATIAPAQLPSGARATRIYNECPFEDSSTDGSADRCAPIANWFGQAKFIPDLRAARIFRIQRAAPDFAPPR